jgi:signal transduction histidine kinase/ligand-binding sensor domain-containing protein/CheY-like chemotaxis protein
MLKDFGRRIAIIGVVCACVFAQSMAASAAPPVLVSELPPRPHFIHFGAEQGLSTKINDLAIDRQGYVWVATGDGLARYDGSGFRYWRRSIGAMDSLPDNEVTLLHIDARDRLWVATWFALSVMDVDQRIPRRIDFQGDAVNCGIDITAMTSAADGVLWIGNHAGDLCRIDLDGRIARLHLGLSRTSLLGDSFAVSLHLQPSGLMLIGTVSGLMRLETNAPHAVPMAIHQDRTGDDGVFVLSPESDGRVWVGAERGPFLLDRDARLLPQPWVPPKKSRRAIVLHARDGGYWIGGYYGLYRRTVRPQAIADIDNGFGIDSGIQKIQEDLEGGLWFSTYSQGLLYLPPTSQRFWLVSGISPSESADIVSADIDPENNVWALANDGLYRSDKAVGELRRIVKADALGLSEPRVVRSCPDGKIWIADGDGILVYDPVARHSRRLMSTVGMPLRHAPEAFSCTHNGSIWISFLGGAVSVLTNTGEVIDEFSSKQTLGADAEAFIDLRFSSLGIPWYSDGHDLRRWDGRQFVRVRLPPGEYVYSLDFVSSRQLWVARFGSLERYDWDGRRLRLVERAGYEEGLPYAEVRSVLATPNGMVWLNTVRGLVQYDTRKRHARLFDVRDGLPGLDFTPDTLRRHRDGPGLSFSKQGIVLFDPDRALPVPRASVLSIDSIELRRGEDTVSFASGGRDGDPQAEMRPGDRDLRIVARLMSFADPAAHRYRFKLRGYDPDWVLQGDRGERVFSSLPPGRYVLEIQGANAEGIWSATRQITLVVQAPWWRRWWAWALYAMAAAGFIWWLAYLDRARLKRRYAFRLIEQKRELAEQASQAKSRFLANLGHEVRTPMTGVLGMSELLLSAPLAPKQHGQVEAIRRAGEHLLRLVNDALDLAKIEAGRFELECIDFQIDTLVDDALALMAPLAERKALLLRVAITDDARGTWCGDPTRIRQILLNLLGNAVKFTERGEVGLCIEVESTGGLRIVVRDTGPGLDEEQQRRLFRRFEQAEGARTASRYGGSGLGLAICQELAVAMGGNIELRSAPGDGASFILSLPLVRGEVLVKTHVIDASSVPYDVLLVEDDAIVADVLIGMLQAQGHRVVHAAHALAAMSEAAIRPFDVALIDLDLPGMDGLALARQLRMQALKVPLVAVTARADPDAESQANAAGFDAFLRKPLTGNALATALRDLFAQRDSVV